MVRVEGGELSSLAYRTDLAPRDLRVTACRVTQAGNALSFSISDLTLLHDSNHHFSIILFFIAAFPSLNHECLLTVTSLCPLMISIEWVSHIIKLDSTSEFPLSY